MKPERRPRVQRKLKITPNLGPTIAFWRRVRRMSQEDLAEAAGVCLSTVKWLERGREYGARVDIIEHICEALDISLEELVGGSRRRWERGQRLPG